MLTVADMLDDKTIVPDLLKKKKQIKIEYFTHFGRVPMPNERIGSLRSGSFSLWSIKD